MKFVELYNEDIEYLSLKKKKFESLNIESYHDVGKSMRIFDDNFYKIISTNGSYSDIQLLNILNSNDKNCFYKNINAYNVKRPNKPLIDKFYWIFGEVENILSQKSDMFSIVITNCSKNIFVKNTINSCVSYRNEFFLLQIDFWAKNKKFSFNIIDYPNERFIKEIDSFIDCSTNYHYSQISSGNYDIMFSPQASAFIFHECVGHLLENKHSDNFLQQKNIVPPITVYSLPMSNDDVLDNEGTVKKSVLVSDGINVHFMSDIYSKIHLNNSIIGGNCRRQSYQFNPSTRMNRIFIKSNNYSSVPSLNNELIEIDRISEGGVNRNTGDFFCKIELGHYKNSQNTNIYFTDYYVKGNVVNLYKNMSCTTKEVSLHKLLCNDSSGVLKCEVECPSIVVTNLRILRKSSYEKN